ncbi:dienelactone hydrolase family protein [Anaeromyxobacter terrae]|uniref:dienelactone hydrolase family protein n=1 Tax=Anaeromyxobacter terrae TaxID=2925406 RepID=UPI001F567FDB|nr:dienelactone hydrolase family protein [Anaeromyxobacter sp. SG22]
MTTRREEIDVETADGVAHAWIHREAKAPRAAVLFYTDAFGVRPSMHEMAARLARLGYLVLLPDVFYRAREFPPFDAATVWSDPPERERLTALLRSLTPERMAVDAGAYLGAIAAQRGVREDRVGVTGYCMGGRLSFLTAALHPDRVRAAAAIHAGGLVTDAADSPHRLAQRVLASLYVGVADEDRGCTPEQQGTLAAALGAAHVRYCLELYPGKKHGFAVSDHAGAYDEDAADRHWRRLESFFGETLG